jgi:hypothetical protein
MCLLDRGYRRSCRDNDIGPDFNELGRDLGKTLGVSFPPAILDYDGAPLGPAHFTQPLLKGRGPYAPRRSRTRTQKPDDRQLSRLLRARRERPCSS